MVVSRAKINNEVKRIKELADNLDNIVIAGYSIKLKIKSLFQFIMRFQVIPINFFQKKDLTVSLM